MVNITLEDGRKLKVKNGTTFEQISKEVGTESKSPIMLALANGKLRELASKVEYDCKVKFIDLEDADGYRVYQRSMKIVLLKAIFKVLEEKEIKKVIIDFSLNKALYCDIESDKKIDDELVIKIANEMKNIIEEDIPIIKESLSLDDAMEYFEEKKMYDKLKLFKYRRVSTVNLYQLGEYKDYFYGYMVPSTGYLGDFRLIKYGQGLILQMPSLKYPHEIKEYKPFNKLFTVFQQSKRWRQILNVENVGGLNDEISKGNIGNLIRVSEALHEKRIAAIADKIITHQDETKVILIAGPSSSGKTTFAQRLSIQLKVNGIIPQPISVDNYFVNREKTPLDEYGDFNFESLYAIDIEKFNEDINKLMIGEEIETPSFNFITGQREYKGNFIKLEENGVLVIEGIHALNEKLTSSIAKDKKFKIYISALTQLNIDDHNRIPTTDGRLLRRIVRDNQYRGTNAATTIDMWASVRRGEEEYIFPYQEEADIMFNSANIYELSVLKSYAEPLLFNISKNSKEYNEAKRLIKFLDYFLGIGGEAIPKNSIIREFIGGSCFR